MGKRKAARHFHRLLWRLSIHVVLLAFGLTTVAQTEELPSATLHTKYLELEKTLANNPFKRPIHLQSAESKNQLNGDIYAVIDAPFGVVSKALVAPENWCDVLILHLNTKYCNASPGTTDRTLFVSIGKKTYEELDHVYGLEFSYKVTQIRSDYFDVLLAAHSGPLGTSDYRIRLEALALAADKSFLHLNYAYASNYFGKLAMTSYLATVGRDKVGFTPANPQPSTDNKTEYIRGTRGVVERNTMRYYLAIEAYLGALSLPGREQFENRLQRWFSSTELYHRQLYEIDQADYLEMKRREYARMQKSP